VDDRAGWLVGARGGAGVSGLIVRAIPSGRVIEMVRRDDHPQGPGVYVTIKLDEKSPPAGLGQRWTGK
jgi:hypothetical protein